MVDAERAFDWLTEAWRSYYERNPVPLPDRFARREFGFLFFGQKFFLRHTGFSRKDDVDRFFRSRAPAHAYYSTAFYKDPGAPRMVEKGWMGAELIFDLDADHVPGSEKLPYAQQLAKVKEHFVRLVDEFIRQDFGFAEGDLLLTFSGGRGYHAHVLAEAALQLSAPERREIVDYVTGTRLDVRSFLREEAVGSRGRGEFKRVVRSLRIDPASTPGWGGRLNRALAAFLEELRSLPSDEMRARLQELPEVGPKTAEKLAREVSRIDLDRVRDEGFLSQGTYLQRMVTRVLAQAVVPLAKGETDEPVTSDTKRLIRLPGSLHGKTGLAVVTLSRDELDAFDPLEDAVVFSDEPVGVDVVRPVAFSLRGQEYALKPGERVRLPEAAAVMAMARGAAAPV